MELSPEDLLDRRLQHGPGVPDLVLETGLLMHLKLGRLHVDSVPHLGHSLLR